MKRKGFLTRVSGRRSVHVHLSVKGDADLAPQASWRKL